MTATSTTTASGGDTLTKSVPLAVTGWGVLSPLGVGAEEFAPAWRERRSGLRDVSGMYEGPMPVQQACALTDFSVRDHLGRKGTSFFDRTTSLTVVTCGLALKDTSLAIDDANRGEVGIVLGSTTGGVQSLCDFITETIVNDPPYLVNPILFPYAVMNGAASSAAIWHQLKGVNATVSDGQASFLAVLKYARNQLRNGYVEAVVAGAVEEFSPHRAWAAEHLRGGQGDRVPLGEGAAAFVLEPAHAVRASGRTPDAEILAVETGLYGQDIDPGDGLAGCISRALGSCGIDPAEVRMVAPSIAGSENRDAVERRGIEFALAGASFTVLPVKDLLGETYSASGALQLAAVLAEHRCDAELDGAVSIITSVTSEGLVGAAVVRGWSRRADRD
ncbi:MULTISPECIES: beta-ketoacyl synthase N-terminal-like domain-containing protein [unclassified Kitasatospora]|uniref:beta-ketoacyl synthase N-terminal-like domain-containing protein n=1 Tax=unclassified Kitasatospora TaxID=2633591 RepID=UPI002475B605|nr:beta-ketoacyl synthase N-terminal-like domain-containing protein [Kitasatospora sp. MAP12-44]